MSNSWYSYSRNRRIIPDDRARRGAPSSRVDGRGPRTGPPRAGSEENEDRAPDAPKIDYVKANKWRAEHGLPLWTNIPGADAKA